jgi:hypothetical protein
VHSQHHIELPALSVDRERRREHRARLFMACPRRRVVKDAPATPEPRQIQSKADLESALLEIGVARGFAKKIAHAGIAALKQQTDLQTLDQKLDILLSRTQPT